MELLVRVPVVSDGLDQLQVPTVGFQRCFHRPSRGTGPPATHAYPSAGLVVAPSERTRFQVVGPDGTTISSLRFDRRNAHALHLPFVGRIRFSTCRVTGKNSPRTSGTSPLSLAARTAEKKVIATEGPGQKLRAQPVFTCSPSN